MSQVMILSGLEIEPMFPLGRKARLVPATTRNGGFAPLYSIPFSSIM